MENFQVDVILNSLQDLKQVRDRKEGVLAVEYAKRVELETRLDSITTHHTATNVKKTQALETLNVLSEQMSLAEAQANCLEVRCCEKRGEVKSINDNMEDHKRLQDDALAQFSLKMAELTDKFRTARIYYKEPQLISELKECDNDTEECRKRISSKKLTVNELKHEVQRCHSNEGDSDVMDHSGRGVTKETWQMLHDMMRDERSMAKTALEREEETLRIIPLQINTIRPEDQTTIICREE